MTSRDCYHLLPVVTNGMVTFSRGRKDILLPTVTKKRTYPKYKKMVLLPFFVYKGVVTGNKTGKAPEAPPGEDY